MLHYSLQISERLKRSIWIILRLHFWSLGYLQTVALCYVIDFYPTLSKFAVKLRIRQGWVEIYYIILSSLHPSIYRRLVSVWSKKEKLPLMDL